MQKSHAARWIRSVFALAIVSLFIVSCGGGGGGGGEDHSPAPSPSGGTTVSTLQASLGSASIIADGASSTRITVDVEDADGNNIQDGTRVQFSTTAGDIDNTTAGIQTAFTTTTQSGQATAVLTSAKTLGTATVTATAGGVSTTAQVTFIAGSVAGITLSASPNNLTADGVSTSTIRAVVRDANGNAVVDGETITFSVSSGTGTLNTPSDLTENGIATITYTAGATPGSETITATSTNGTTSQTTISLIAAQVGTVIANAGAPSIIADGFSNTTITATVRDTNGNPVVDGTTVTFSTTAGDIDRATFGQQTSVTTTTIGGIAAANLSSTTTIGSATITATAGGISGNATVAFIPGPPGIVLLNAAPNNLTADGASKSTVRALVFDANGNAVADGSTISFRITTGSGSLSAFSGATIGGIVTVTYTASTTAGVETVSAKAVNGITNTTNITLISASVGTVTLTPGANSIVADGTSQTLVTADVKDTSGNAVADGTAVTFTTTAGDIDNATAGTQTTLSTTTTNGKAVATLTSAANVGTASLTTTAGGVSGNATVSFVPGPVNTIDLTATPNNLTADGTSTSTLRALVTDANGNAVADGETLSFTVTTGTGILSAATATTTGGVATVTYTASNTAGTETVTVQATNGSTDTVNITLISASVGTVTLTTGANSIVADGTSQTLVTADVKDTSGNAVADGITVTFTTTAGDIDDTTAGTQTTLNTTTTNGKAVATLISAANVGTASLTATAGGVSGNASVSFVPGPVDTIDLTATPNNLTADGASTSTLRALVTDANGNAVADGETLSFTVTTGTGILSAATATTSGGVATVTYTASSTAGTETVTVQATNGSTDTVNITLIGEQIAGITLSITDDSLISDGLNSTAIAASVVNASGNPVNNGTIVSFTTTSGDIDKDIAGDQLTSNAQTVSGTATVTLRASTTAGQNIIRATSGSISQVATVLFIAGPAAVVTLQANPSVIPADGASSTTLTAVVRDANNNPVVDETEVKFFTTAGTLSAPSAETGNGTAAVQLTSSTTNETAQITAVAETVSDTLDVDFGTGPGSGEPVFIEITALPGIINVIGTGSASTATITARVKDENGQPYADSTDNLQFAILSGPTGGEVLDSGDGTPSASETISTVSGIGSLSLVAGQVSGTVRVQVTALNDSTGAPLAPAQQISAVSTPIGIEAGDPFNITIYPSSSVIDNGDGSISWIISAMVQDQYGNPVEDNTGVYFGVIDNLPSGYLSAAVNGATTAGSNTFTAAGTDFVSDGIVKFDTLIIFEGADEGGHIILNPAAGTLDLLYNLTDSAVNLDFAVGNAEQGIICGVVPTGNQHPDATCTPSEGAAIKGVAHTRLTWGAAAIWKPFYLYAETEGRQLGDTLGTLAAPFEYPAIAPVIIEVALSADEVLAGASGITVSAHLHDSADPMHDIQQEPLVFTTNNTNVSGFGAVGTATTTDTTNANGRASVSTLTTQTCLDLETEVEITVSSGSYKGSQTLTINPTAATAEFTYTDLDDSNHALIVDNSTTLSGTTLAGWSWDFDNDGVEDSAAQNPGTVSFGGPGTYVVTLTVTNSSGCSNTLSKTVEIE